MLFSEVQVVSVSVDVFQCFRIPGGHVNTPGYVGFVVSRFKGYKISFERNDLAIKDGSSS